MDTSRIANRVNAFWRTSGANNQSRVRELKHNYMRRRRKSLTFHDKQHISEWHKAYYRQYIKPLMCKLPSRTTEEMALRRNDEERKHYLQELSLTDV
jgi:hypothetical protein